MRAVSLKRLQAAAKVSCGKDTRVNVTEATATLDNDLTGLTIIVMATTREEATQRLWLMLKPASPRTL